MAVSPCDSETVSSVQAVEAVGSLRAAQATLASLNTIGSRLRLSLESLAGQIRSTIVPGSPARSSMSSGGRVTTLSVQTEELESYALSQTSFPELVRRCSVSSHTVLKRGGSVLGNENDQTKHERFGYDEEEETTYDYFISHNWSVPRWKKFMALCMIWSGKSVLVCCCLVQVACFILVAAGALPLTPMINSNQGIQEIQRQSIWCSGASFLTFFLVFLFCSDVLQILGVKGYRTFLDKVCVDQSDEEKKREGIGAITAFLYHSDAMVVLYSEMYLTRLWTVYELTTFLALKPDAKILVQPVILGPLAVYFVLIQFLRIPELLLIPSDLEQLKPPSWSLLGLFIGLDLLALCIGAIFLRMWGTTRASMQQQIDQFSFESAACHDENDRVQILSAIKKIARQEGLVRDDAPTKACIKSYEIIVRTILPRRMKHAFQLTGIPCQVAFLIALPCFSALLDRWALELRSLHGAGRGALEIVAELLNIAAKELCVPIALGLAGIFSGIRRGSVCFEVLCTFACFVLLALGLWLPQSPMMPAMETLIPSTDLRCVVLGLALLLQCGIILGIYGRPWCKWEHR